MNPDDGNEEKIDDNVNEDVVNEKLLRSIQKAMKF